jgi:hypothetical protein
MTAKEQVTAIAEVERRLSVSLPPRVRVLHEREDGHYSGAGQWYVVWLLARVAEDNLRAWGDGTLTRDLLAFGDDGTGNSFCVSLQSDADEVVRWNWLDSDIEVNESDMEQFLQTWFNVR